MAGRRPDDGGDGAGAGGTQAYTNSLVDFHMVLDLLPGLAGAFFSRALPANLTWGQVRSPPPRRHCTSSRPHAVAMSPALFCRITCTILRADTRSRTWPMPRMCQRYLT